MGLLNGKIFNGTIILSIIKYDITNCTKYYVLTILFTTKCTCDIHNCIENY